MSFHLSLVFVVTLIILTGCKANSATPASKGVEASPTGAAYYSALHQAESALQNVQLLSGKAHEIINWSELNGIFTFEFKFTSIPDTIVTAKVSSNGVTLNGIGGLN